MKKMHCILIALGIVAGHLLYANFAEAASITTSLKVPCTNENFEHSPYCQAPVDWFVVNDDGSSFGQLESGAQFVQYPLTNEIGVNLQRFQLEEAYWYVSTMGIIYAENDLQALSIFLYRL